MAWFSRGGNGCGDSMIRSRWGLLYGALVLVLALSSLLVSCGNDDAATSTSSSLAVSDTTSLTEATSSTTTMMSSTTSGIQTSTTSSTTTTTTLLTTTTKSTTTTIKPTTTTKKTTTTTAKPTTTTVKGEVVLTLVGSSGTKELTMADLKAMSASSGYGGWKNQLENITAPAAYKGVRVTALLDLVGGGSSATIIASDGYEQKLSGSVLSGDVNLYDPTTGEQISSISGSIKTILAYAKNGSALSSGEGPLRIAFVSPEKDQVTDSAMWVKMVIKIKVN